MIYTSLRIVRFSCLLVVEMQVGKLSRMRSDILINLTADVPHTTHKLLGLRDLFPGVNVSLLVSRWPYLVCVVVDVVR